MALNIQFHGKTLVTGTFASHAGSSHKTFGDQVKLTQCLDGTMHQRGHYILFEIGPW